ncbi:MAG: serine/threonine-protein kinase [Pseudomonadota bacterium]
MTTSAPTGDDGVAVKGGSENCLPIGTRLSDFEITGVLGEGGFGIVYIAYDHSLQRTVAIKEYMPGALAMRGGDRGVSLRAERHQDTFKLGLKSFINEARFLAQFDHPSLVKVYRFWEQNRTAYTAMQYYHGRTIKDIVGASPELVDEAWCRKILRQILQALEMLYTMQIVHRDVSPDNIIVQENGDAVLLDFGSARQIIGDMTKGLTVILKPGYAPVEQYAGDASLEQGPFTDIYALAAVMYFAIVKQAPPSSIARMIKDPVTPLVLQAPQGYSAEFLAAIDKGLAVLSQDRPQTIDEFRGLLGIVSLGPPPPVRAIGSGQRGAPAARADAPDPDQTIIATPVAAPDSAAAAPIPLAPAPLAGRKRWQFIAAAVALVLVAGSGLYALVHSTDDDTIMIALPHTPAPSVRPAAVETPAAETPKVAEPLAAAAPAPAPEPPAATPDEAKAEPLVAPEVAPPAPEPKPAPVEMVAYKLAIKPWGTVYVNGRERGVSPPMKRLLLPAGKHKVRIVNPSFPDHTLNLDSGKSKYGTIEHDFASAKK